MQDTLLSLVQLKTFVQVNFFSFMVSDEEDHINSTWISIHIEMSLKSVGQVPSMIPQKMYGEDQIQCFTQTLYIILYRHVRL